jgi:TonB family protein
MKNLLLGFALLFSFLSNAQSTQIYEVHEVDSAAVPRGGYTYLTTFVNTNLQIPYMAKVAKVNGYVTLAGVVDEEGKISNIEVLRGLRPDCDKEAVRVFGLFNAWQSALKEGKKVRQKVSCRVPFKFKQDIYFTDGVESVYFDKDSVITSNPDDYKYVLKIQVDTITGLPIDEISSMIFFEIKKGKEIQRASSIQRKSKPVIYSPIYSEQPTDITQTYYNLEFLGINKKLLNTNFTLFWDGALFKKESLVDGKSTYPTVEYYRNGAVKNYINYTDSTQKIYRKISWYANGQVASITKYMRVFPDKSSMASSVKNTKLTPAESIKKFAEASLLDATSPVTLELLENQWNIDGTQNVVNGEGIADFRSNYNKNRNTYSETGLITKLRREGLWKVVKDDGFVMRKAHYKNGFFEQGVSFNSDKDSVVYQQIEQQAYFIGGMSAFASFLSKNLKYPSGAQLMKEQGRSYIQFIVNVDGTVEDLSVLKSSGSTELDNEAIRVIKNSSRQWEAGMQFGRKVKSKFTVPINFSLTR